MADEDWIAERGAAEGSNARGLMVVVVTRYYTNNAMSYNSFAQL